MAVTQDIFWTDFTDFDNKNGSFEGNVFIWKIKEIRDGNSHLRHQNIHFLTPRFLVFVACIVTSKVLGIGAAECYWDDVKTV